MCNEKWMVHTEIGCRPNCFSRSSSLAQSTLYKRRASTASATIRAGNDLKISWSRSRGTRQTGHGRFPFSPRINDIIHLLFIDLYSSWFQHKVEGVNLLLFIVRWQYEYHWKQWTTNLVITSVCISCLWKHANFLQELYKGLMPDDTFKVRESSLPFFICVFGNLCNIGLSMLVKQLRLLRTGIQ